MQTQQRQNSSSRVLFASCKVNIQLVNKFKCKYLLHLRSVEAQLHRLEVKQLAILQFLLVAPRTLCLEFRTRAATNLVKIPSTKRRNNYKSIDCTFSGHYKRFSRKIETKSLVQGPFLILSPRWRCVQHRELWTHLIGSRANEIDYFQILSWVSIDRFWRESTTSIVASCS